MNAVRIHREGDLTHRGAWRLDVRPRPQTAMATGAQMRRLVKRITGELRSRLDDDVAVERIGASVRDQREFVFHDHIEGPWGPR